MSAETFDSDGVSADRHQRLVDLIDGHIRAESTEQNTERGGRITSWGPGDLHLITEGDTISLVGALWSVSGEHKIRETIEEGRVWLNSPIWCPGRNMVDGSAGRVVAGPDREIARTMSAADEFPKHAPEPEMRWVGLAPLRMQLGPGTPREAPTPSPHKNRDPRNGDCIDCGATVEAIADGLAPACFEYSGPHAEGLRALFRTIQRREGDIKALANNLAAYESEVVVVSRHLRTAKAHLEELKASFEKLKAAG
jgi:hypothetical protein